MISCVRSLVCVIQHGSCAGCWAAWPRKLNTGTGPAGGAPSGPGMPSPGCASSTEKSMLRPSMRGGVPVFSRPCGSFSSFRRADSVTAGGSPARPPAWFCRPTWMRPSRKVPAVRTTLRARKAMPACVTAPVTRSPSTLRSSTACWNSHRFGWFSSRRRMAAL